MTLSRASCPREALDGDLLIQDGFEPRLVVEARSLDVVVQLLDGLDPVLAILLDLEQLIRESVCPVVEVDHRAHHTRGRGAEQGRVARGRFDGGEGCPAGEEEHVVREEGSFETHGTQPHPLEELPYRPPAEKMQVFALLQHGQYGVLGVHELLMGLRVGVARGLDEDKAGGTQDPCALPHQLQGIHHVLEHIVENDHVKGVVG